MTQSGRDQEQAWLEQPETEKDLLAAFMKGIQDGTLPRELMMGNEPESGSDQARWYPPDDDR